MGVQRPVWWTYPLECREGHLWGPGRVIGPHVRPMLAQWAPSVAAQVVVDMADRYRALAYRGSYPFHRPAADVADGEDPGQAGLQEHGGTLERPAVRRVPTRHEVGPGDHEPPPVAPDLVRQPLGAGLGSDQDEYSRGRNGL